MVVFRDVTAPWLASALALAAELDLAERVEGGCDALDGLASQLSLPKESLERLLRILEAHGYFRLTPGGRVLQTSLSRVLCRDVGGAFVRLQGSSWYREAFLPEVVLSGWREGKTPFDVAHGLPFFEYLEEQTQRSELFSGAMANITRFCAPYLVGELGLRPGERYLDVGGGDGEFARALSRRYPNSDVEVFDRIPADSESDLRAHQGDLFGQYPGGFQGVILKSILHDWPDSQALEVLRRCREAVSLHGRLFVIECLLPQADGLSLTDEASFAMDWNVWTTLSGRERTFVELDALLTQTGWKKVALRKTATPYQILEAVAR